MFDVSDRNDFNFTLVTHVARSLETSRCSAGFAVIILFLLQKRGIRKKWCDPMLLGSREIKTVRSKFAARILIASNVSV